MLCRQRFEQARDRRPRPVSPALVEPQLNLGWEPV
jgi:hypothetical protein